MEREAGGAGEANPLGGLGDIFSDPQLIPKLAANPRTSHFLADQEFMAKLQRLQQNPKAANQEIFQDPRLLTVMGAMFGVDVTAGGPGSEAEQMSKEARAKEVEEDVPMPDAKPFSTNQPDPEPVLEKEDQDSKAAKEAKIKADEQKKLGTEMYKKRQFDAAIEHYSKAWELHKDITYLSNLGAAYFEKGDYEKCIEVCKQAVTEGREMRADFKLIAK
jgi:stress-induced-phosphoprotein 1